MTTGLIGAMSMRQNDFGGLSRASRIAARITAGCVTATVRDVLPAGDQDSRHGHRVRSPGHAVILATRLVSARSPSSRPASVENTRPMLAHSTSWVPSETSLNS